MLEPPKHVSVVFSCRSRNLTPEKSNSSSGQDVPISTSATVATPPCFQESPKQPLAYLRHIAGKPSTLNPNPLDCVFAQTTGRPNKKRFHNTPANYPPTQSEHQDWNPKPYTLIWGLAGPTNGTAAAHHLAGFSKLQAVGGMREDAGEK